MTSQSDLLLKVLQQPEMLLSLRMAEWDRMLPLARRTNLLGRLAARAQEGGLLTELPPGPQWHLRSSDVATAHNQRAIRWEIRCIERALHGIETPMVLLKGAAYLVSSLPPARGRICADVDLLVKKEAISAVETALRQYGWKTEPIRPLDEKNFRATLHELPPMIHQNHDGELDVHHNILPATDTLRVDPAKLLEAAIPLAPATRFSILAPCDMVLHNAAHMFRNGRFQYGLRDLVDLDDLLRHFSASPGFWDRLVARAAELDLKIPFFWGLRYAERFLATPVPELTGAIVREWRPILPPLCVMDRLIEQAVLPPENGNEGLPQRFSRRVLGLYPIPRLSAMASPVFWLKRFPWPRKTVETPAEQCVLALN